MKNSNKGFTLVEVLAVISIIGVVAVLVIPMLLDLFYKSRGILDEYTKESLLDGAKMYITDLDRGILEYTYNGDNPIDIEGTTYNKGDKLTGYDLKVFAIDNNGINVSIKDLVSNGYFDETCNYEENKKNCKIKETCVVKVKINHELSENQKYYVTTGYDAEIVEGCE